MTSAARQTSLSCTEAKPGGSAALLDKPQAWQTGAQTAESQPVVLYADRSYLFTDELFDKYPPPEHMEIDAAAFSELRAELLGQQIGGRLPNQGQLKRFSCIEQFLLYDAYASYW